MFTETTYVRTRNIADINPVYFIILMLSLKLQPHSQNTNPYPLPLFGARAGSFVSLSNLIRVFNFGTNFGTRSTGVFSSISSCPPNQIGKRNHIPIYDVIHHQPTSKPLIFQRSQSFVLFFKMRSIYQFTLLVHPHPTLLRNPLRGAPSPTVENQGVQRMGRKRRECGKGGC